MTPIPPKLYLDENVHKQVASSLRLRGYDAISAHEEENWGLEDSEQLDYAIRQQRALFTFDPRDFIRLHKSYLEEEKDHYGIIVSKQVTIGRAVNRLSQLLMERSAKSLKNVLLWL